MDVTIYREPCWLLEAAELVYGLVNQVPAEKLTAPGPHCIPPDEVRRIQAEACASISPEDPLVQFYFRGVRVEGETNRLSCLARVLLYSTLEIAHPDVDGTVKDLSESWHALRRAGYRVDGIDCFSMRLERRGGDAAPSLAMELLELPVPKLYQMQLLEVLSAYDEHLKRVADLLRPVVQALQELLTPWVQRAGELMDEWETFFRIHTVQEFFQQRTSAECGDVEGLEIAFRYIDATGGPIDLREQDKIVRIHMGVSMQPTTERPDVPEQLEEWELSAMRLMASSARMEMLHAMSGNYMSAQELAQKLNLNSGSVFRDLNSLFAARLLLIQNIGGRNYYRTNLQIVRRITSHVVDYLDKKEAQ